MTAHPALTVERSGRPSATGHRATLELPADLLGAAGGLGEAAVLENRDEFLATVSRHDVGGAQPYPQDLAEQTKQGIAGQMPVAAIEVAEVVEIEHDRGQVPGGCPALETGDSQVQRGVEVPAVVQPVSPSWIARAATSSAR
jgi:hypothetical protein